MNRLLAGARCDCGDGTPLGVAHGQNFTLEQATATAEHTKMVELPKAAEAGLLLALLKPLDHTLEHRTAAHELFKLLLLWHIKAGHIGRPDADSNR